VTALAPLLLGLLGLGGRASALQDAGLDSRLRSAEDLTHEGVAFVELDTPRTDVYLGELVRVTLRVGLEEGFRSERAVQPFPRHLDVPVRVVVPWTEGLAGADVRGLETVESLSSERGELAVNESVHAAHRVGDRELDGRTYRVHELAVLLTATRSGELEVPGPTLALAYATRFEETLLDPRVPADRVDARVVGEPLRLRVLSLPGEGRPPDFTGAVGPLTVRAEARNPTVAAGRTLKLELHVEGAGNPREITTPAWKEIGGFRVLGILDESRGTTRVFTLDLQPADARLWQVPPIRFDYFDPTPPAGYRVASSAPVDVTIEAAAVERPVSSQPDQGARATAAPTPEAKEPGRSGSWPWFAGAGLGVVVLLLLARRLARYGSLSPPRPGAP